MAQSNGLRRRFRFPGSIECAECRASMIPDVEITLASSTLEVRPDYDGEERLLQLEAVLELDIKLYEEEQVEILADVYTPCTGAYACYKPGDL